MRNCVLRWVLGACTAMLSGCSVLQSMDRDTSTVEREPPGEVAIVVPTQPPEPAEKTAPPPEDAIPRPKRKPDMVDPKTLVGLDKATIAKLFGQPHHIVVAQPAHVWSWRTDDCEMRLFLYPDVAGRTFRALAYEISAGSEKHKAVVIDTCASRLKWTHAEDSR